MVLQYKNTPKLIALLTVIAVIGAFFPIYGISLGGFKLTLFRIGVFPLVLTQLGCLFKYNKQLISLLVVFLLFRGFSLLWSEDMPSGISQLFWFFEGTCLLLSVSSLSNKYIDYSKIFLVSVLIIGAISIAFIFLQALMYFGFGYKLYVPFSQSIPEIATNEQMWNYPIYGAGRIVGAFYEPNMSGSMCGYYFALVLPLVYSKETKFKSFLLVGILVIMIASFFTGSRQSLLSIAISIFFFFIVFSENKLKNIFRAILVLGVIVCVASIFVDDSFWEALEESDNVLNRIENSAGDSDEMSGGRFSYMQRVWKEYGMSHFLLGVGEGTTHGGGHNVFLAIFLENGIITFIVFLMMLYHFWRKAFRNFKRIPKPINLSSFLIVVSWVFLMLVNWAQLNQSLSFVYLCFVFISSSIHMNHPTQKYG